MTWKNFCFWPPRCWRNNFALLFYMKNRNNKRNEIFHNFIYIENVILSASSSTHRKICFFLSEKSYWLRREEKDGWDESVPANKKMPCWKCHTLSSVTSRYNSFLLVFMLLLCRQNIGWETKIQKANPELFINNVNVNHLPHISGNILYNLFAWYTL